MTRAERIRNFPKTGWRNFLARQLASLSRHPAPSAFLDYQTKTALHLPFAGEWYVYWGGRSPAQNRHVVANDQRFAYDFLILSNGHRGQSFRGSGQSNTDYLCFGQPVYAPADGTVLKAENDMPDNQPGEMNPKSVLGNYVVLDHGSGEFSFLVHLRQGTLSVNVGDQVHRGQQLAQCGNSGNSSEPHLHYHLQNTPAPFLGDGLPAFFVEYVADGKSLDRGQPVARQTVRSTREFSGQ
ncbi:MAG TPA: M23 family metallopeptidase [Candidatus Aquilonibacter sp.]|nr:M23 family metallopeptidase [Candidatus Aquilonibacter sp.]